MEQHGDYDEWRTHDTLRHFLMSSTETSAVTKSSSRTRERDRERERMALSFTSLVQQIICRTNWAIGLKDGILWDVYFSSGRAADQDFTFVFEDKSVEIIPLSLSKLFNKNNSPWLTIILIHNLNIYSFFCNGMCSLNNSGSECNGCTSAVKYGESV